MIGMPFNLKRIRTHRYQARVVALTVGFLLLLLTACTVKLVQPYDEKLLNDTEAFYKKAATTIEEGRSASPRTDDERNKIIEPTKHPAHISAFESKYDALIVDSDALILRAIAGSQSIDSVGEAVQTKINELIEAKLPTLCPELKENLGKVSLTAMNFVDLKCLVLKWRKDHADKELTEGTGILKKANWEGRQVVLFETVLAIEKAERFKKQ